MPFSPRFVDGRGTLYVNQPTASGDEVLKRYDFARGEPEREPLVSTPGFDFSGRMVSETTGSRALGVRVQVDAETTHWFDPRMKALQDEADMRLPGRVNRLSCRRCDAPDMTVLVRSFSDRDPGQFWVHTAADGGWRKVGDVRRGTDPRRMATTTFERIPTRDGQRLPVWITRPPGAQGPLPTVVLVHGGPWVRGRVWEWDADAQFLASRGYLVIEPEFRGSRGYGHAWYRAGWREWGRSMQDDVADALLWAAKEGQADPRRACIAGASYGGYSTLMGLIRHPELYRCGVAWVAVTDPRLMFEWRYGTDQSDEVRELDYPRLIGDPVVDAERINAVTPVLHAARIQAPVLLAMGGEDRRVLLVHGRRMRDALTEAGRPPEWVVYDDEGHGWYKLSTRLDFASRLESFLAKHLKP
jgi:dipeptidyl aminopeptidase/acylaminoacyl peptidase